MKWSCDCKWCFMSKSLILLVTLVLLTSGCDLSTVDWCETPCGTWINRTANPELRCEPFVQLERMAIKHLSPQFPDVDICRRLSVVSISTVKVPEGQNWFHPWWDSSMRVGGWFDCVTNEMRLVHRPDELYYLGSYTHEVAHVAECPAWNPGHIGWDDGVFAAIDCANTGQNCPPEEP